VPNACKNPTGPASSPVWSLGVIRLEAAKSTRSLTLTKDGGCEPRCGRLWPRPSPGFGVAGLRAVFGQTEWSITHDRRAVSGRDRQAATDARTEGRRQALADHLRSAREDHAFGRPLPVAPDAEGATFNSIVGNDMPWPGDRASLLADSEGDGKAYPLVGWGNLSQPCAFRNRPAVHLRAPTGLGVPPVLMVQTERDASVEAYLVDGVVPAEGQSCPGKPIPPPVPVDDPRNLPGSDPLDSVLRQLSRLVGPTGRLPLSTLTSSRR
jgi:hypothetical protein